MPCLLVDAPSASPPWSRTVPYPQLPHCQGVLTERREATSLISDVLAFRAAW